jgi:2-polyprenyl-3-methyl-5-hydroxy-6-metoxy-1,4-benzoquinol methylase
MIDNSWKLIGDSDPYYGVLTTENFKTKNLNENSITEFYDTGYDHVKAVTNRLKSGLNLPSDQKFDNVLDFGCGTGRLVIPFAEQSKKVTGVDISEGMLKEAAVHIKKKGLTNISLLQIDDVVTYQFRDTYDLVHTYIVLQHINENYGYEIINKLASIIKPGGFGIVHLLFDGNMSKKSRIVLTLKRKYKWFNQLTNIVNGRPINRPFMQMNYYNLNKVFKILYSNNVGDIFTEMINHEGFLGVIMYFQKKTN